MPSCTNDAPFVAVALGRGEPPLGRPVGDFKTYSDAFKALHSTMGDQGEGCIYRGRYNEKDQRTYFRLLLRVGDGGKTVIYSIPK